MSTLASSTTPSERETKLKIHPAPFKPSHLSIPVSPFSPRTPLQPTNYPTNPTRGYPAPDSSAQTPPPPLQWIWQCHQCNRNYGLGVTRRCLEDGHTFCSGTTTIKNWRKTVNPRRVRRHRACGSEFDYQGWKSWGRWRRSGKRREDYRGEEENGEDSDKSFSSSSSSSSLASSSESESEDVSTSVSTSPHSSLTANRANQKPNKDCWNTCDYPSECRWGRKFGVHTPITASFPTVPVVSRPTGPATAPPTTFEGILKADNIKSASPETKKAGKTDFWGLLASATGRKSAQSSSPLASVTEEEDGDPQIDSVTKDRDGDVVMSTGPVSETHFANPQHITSPASGSGSTSTSRTTTSESAPAPIVTLKDLLLKKTTSSNKTNTKRARSSSYKPTKPERPDPVAQRAERGSRAPGECEFGLRSHEDLTVVEFARLERVKSRHNRYGSAPDAS